MVVVGCVDFFPNSIDRITRRLADLVKFLPPVYDDDPGNFDTSVKEQLGAARLSKCFSTQACSFFALYIWAATLRSAEVRED